METDKIIENMRSINHQIISDIKKADSKAGTEQLTPEPVDIYQQTQDRIYDVNQKSFPRGSSPAITIAVNAVVDGQGGEGLAHAYKRARDDSDSLKERGENGRAELIRAQYMNEHFLPAVETVANSASPDELLANKKALDALDQYAMMDGGGSGKGYTATYIRQAYGDQLGQVEGRSDPFVRSEVQRLNRLLDEGQNRTALGIANKLKDQIDKGEKMSSDEDYELISRVVAFYGN